MALSKGDFLELALAEISRDPALAALYRAGDPHVTQGLAAQAAMLARMSEYVAVASMEQFTMARDSTVLADAASKGIIRYATPTEVLARVTNPAPSALTVAAGRQLLDPQGRGWIVMRGALIPAAGEGLVLVKQVARRAIRHIVAQHAPFYRIEVPNPAMGYLAAIDVVGFTYQPSFSNTLPGDLVYSLKVSEQQTVLVQFGLDGVAGVQLSAGAGVTINVEDTEGAIDDVLGAALAFEYLDSASEAAVKVVVESVEVQGRNPMDIATLREMCSYPSLYDEDAVFLGDFDALLRRKLAPFEFLSVWNEQRHERATGEFNFDWMNTLFVAARKDGTATAALRAKIEATILAADDGYKVQHVDVLDAPVTLALTAYVNPVYEPEQVRQEIRRVVLEEYGPASAWSKRGDAKLRKLAVYNLLRQKVEAMSDTHSDLEMSVTESVVQLAPWHFRYVSADSLSVTVLENDRA